jgi:hypothetical protein
MLRQNGHFATDLHGSALLPFGFEHLSEASAPVSHECHAVGTR